MAEPLRARVVYTAEIVFTVDVGRERVEGAVVDAGSLRHVETELEFSPLGGLESNLERSAQAIVGRNPTAAISWHRTDP